MRDSTGKAIVGALIFLAASIIFGAGVIASSVHKDGFGTVPIVAGTVLGIMGLVTILVTLSSGGPPGAA